MTTMVSVAFSPLFTFLGICVIGAAFAIAASEIVRRFGRSQLIPFWLGVTIILGALGAMRVLAAQRGAGVDPARVSVIGTYGLIIVALAVMLAIPTLQMWRRDARVANDSLVRRGLTGAACMLLGLLAVVLIALVLDFANVPFIPIK